MYREELGPRLQKSKVWFSCNYSDVKGVMAALHWHDAYEILYVHRGHAEQRINAETFKIVPGDIVIIRPGDIHYTEAVTENGCDIDYIQFTVDLMPDFEGMLEDSDLRVIHYEDENIYKIFDGLKQARKSKENGKELITVGLVYTLCGYLINIGKVSRRQYRTVINDICRYIESNTDMRLETVAAHFNYSAEHISRLFRKEMGISYRDFCTKIKMRRAVKLLNNGNQGILEIAVSLGYSDESSFIRAFKCIYGITPNAFRKRQYVI